AMLGERLMPELLKLLGGPAVSYGKGAIVGVAGEMEHGGACVHPMLGKPVRYRTNPVGRRTMGIAAAYPRRGCGNPDRLRSGQRLGPHDGSSLAAGRSRRSAALAPRPRP